MCVRVSERVCERVCERVLAGVYVSMRVYTYMDNVGRI